MDVGVSFLGEPPFGLVQQESNGKATFWGSVPKSRHTLFTRTDLVSFSLPPSRGQSSRCTEHPLTERLSDGPKRGH